MLSHCAHDDHFWIDQRVIPAPLVARRICFTQLIHSWAKEVEANSSTLTVLR